MTFTTPVEIDTELARIYEATYRLAAEATNLRRIIENNSSSQRLADRLEEVLRKLDDLEQEQMVLEAEYTGWTRAFLVFDGHVHSSMDCTTCYSTTQYGWLPSLSGHSEDEIVAAAGSDACTVCYPTAPVATAGPRTVLHHTEEAAQAARTEREAKRQATAAKKAANALEPAIRTRNETVKTVTAAKIWMTDFYAYGFGTEEEHTAIAHALAAKLGTTAAEQAEAARKRAANR